MQDNAEIVDRIFHIEEMKEELQELAGGEAIIGHVDERLSPQMEEQFLEYVLEFEHADMVPHRELLARDGVALPPPEELTDDDLAQRLEGVIQALARRRIYLESTDHLSDRELCTRLWAEVLDGEGPELDPEGLTNCHIDILGGCSEEDINLRLTYYADERERADWARDFPEDVIPPHQDPPFDRDRHLPKPPPPPSRYDDPEVLAMWVAECRERLARELGEEGLRLCTIGEEPVSYAPGLACAWGVESALSTGEVDWWVINGDVPTNYLPVSEAPGPRTFLRVIGQCWRATSGVLERGDQPAELAPIPPEDRARLGALLRRRSDILEEWAADDGAWEEA